MKTRKTPTHLRGTYKQYDEDGNLLCEVKPGDYGVTEVVIDQMHRLDDKEVRISIKERRVPEFMEEAAKKAKADWIAEFEEKYGYTPKPGEYPDFTHRTFASLDDEVPTDSGEDTIGDHSRIAAQIASRPFDEEESAAEYMRRLVRTGDFTDREREVYEMVFVQGIGKKEAGEKLGISAPRVTEIIGNIMKKIATDKELAKKFR